MPMLPAKQRLIEFWQKNSIVTNKQVLDAFAEIPREEFVLPKYKKEAYEDNPLPILAGQTISQPTTVVIMLEALELAKGQTVLEIGAGSGYNAALMSKIIGDKGVVYTTERIKSLAAFARKNLQKIGVKNVKVFNIDGSKGIKRYAPFDRIICTAAAQKIPKALVEQLKEWGIIIIPVGPSYSQQMIRARKFKGKILTETLGEFMFVPLVTDKTKKE